MDALNTKTDKSDHYHIVQYGIAHDTIGQDRKKQVSTIQCTYLYPQDKSVNHRTMHNIIGQYKTFQNSTKQYFRRNKMKQENIITINAPTIKHATIVIEGDGDLILNKMNARTERALNLDDRKKVKETPNAWEDIITSIHWRDELTCKNTYQECDEKMYHKLLKENAPCITAFGLKKSFNEAVVRNEIDKYSTKFDNAVNVVATKGLIPISFTSAFIDQRLMSPKKGSPVTCKLNHFCGWKAEFEIAYTDNIYSLAAIISIIQLAGFGRGIGSGRTSGYGRYHVVEVKGGTNGI